MLYSLSLSFKLNLNKDSRKLQTRTARFFSCIPARRPGLSVPSVLKTPLRHSRTRRSASKNCGCEIDAARRIPIR